MFFPPSRNFLHWNEMIVKIVQLIAVNYTNIGFIKENFCLTRWKHSLGYIHETINSRMLQNTNIRFINLGMNNNSIIGFFLLFFLRIFSSFFLNGRRRKFHENFLFSLQQLMIDKCSN